MVSLLCPGGLRFTTVWLVLAVVLCLLAVPPATTAPAARDDDAGGFGEDVLGRPALTIGVSHGQRHHHKHRRHLDQRADSKPQQDMLAAPAAAFGDTKSKNEEDDFMDLMDYPASPPDTPMVFQPKSPRRPAWQAEAGEDTQKEAGDEKASAAATGSGVLRVKTQYGEMEIETGEPLSPGEAVAPDGGQLVDLREILTEDEIARIRSQLFIKQIYEKLGIPGPGAERQYPTVVSPSSPSSMNTSRTPGTEVGGGGASVPLPPRRRLPATLERQLEDELLQADEWTPEDAGGGRAQATDTLIFFRPSDKCPSSSRPLHQHQRRVGRGKSVSCFEFTLPAGLSAGEVGTAQLMLYTLGGEEAGRNHSLQVWELTEPYHHRKSRRFQAYKMVDMSHEGWVTFDFQNSVKMWANEQSRTHVVEIECKSCRPGQPVEELGENAPILNLKLEPKGFQRRSRRRAPRSPHNLGACHPTHPGCCLHEHTINFKEEDPRLKDYIVQPERFRSNYCGGSCSFKVNPVHISMPSIRHKLLHNSSVAGQVLNMCCVPTKFSSLHILHYDEMGNLVRSAIPNMLATDCGCQI